MSNPNAASATCMACGEAGHRALRCKSIGVPPHGFHTGGNGGGGHDHDDDDEKAAAITVIKPSVPSDSSAPCGSYGSSVPYDGGHPFEGAYHDPF